MAFLFKFFSSFSYYYLVSCSVAFLTSVNYYYSLGYVTFIDLRSSRRRSLSSCFRRFFASRCSSRLSSSSGGMGSPLQVCGCALCAGRPGPFFVCSRLRHFARRFWNHTCNHTGRNFFLFRDLPIFN